MGKKGENKAKKGGSPNTGTSSIMDKKGWVDPQGRKGKGYGVYRYDKKYGANVDGYSPIYTPTEWSETGDTYAGGSARLGWPPRNWSARRRHRHCEHERDWLVNSFACGRIFDVWGEKKLQGDFTKSLLVIC